MLVHLFILIHTIPMKTAKPIVDLSNYVVLSDVAYSQNFVVIQNLLKHIEEPCQRVDDIFIYCNECGP